MTINNPDYHYRAFSLEIASQLALPELQTSTAAPDITVRFGKVSRLEADAPSDRSISANQDGVHLFWERAGSFLMRAGKEIVIQPVDGVKESVLRMGVLGPGFAAILQQRGHLVLHASAVVIGKKAFAFVGWKGQGKSTTAASLFARGCPLLTDDLLALNGKEGQTILAHPGFPQFKLWPDSAESALSEDKETLPRLMPDFDKRVKSVSDGFATEAVPLGAIYVLDFGQELAMHRISPQETFKQIVSNTFCARYGNQIFKGHIGTDHLQNVARVTANVPVFRFERPSSLAKLDLLADFVILHAMSL